MKIFSRVVTRIRPSIVEVSEATVQRKLLNSVIVLITHQKIIRAVYKQTTRVVKLSIFIALFAKLV